MLVLHGEWSLISRSRSRSRTPLSVLDQCSDTYNPTAIMIYRILHFLLRVNQPVVQLVLVPVSRL